MIVIGKKIVFAEIYWGCEDQSYSTTITIVTPSSEIDQYQAHTLVKYFGPNIQVISNDLQPLQENMGRYDTVQNDQNDIVSLDRLTRVTFKSKQPKCVHSKPL